MMTDPTQQYAPPPDDQAIPVVMPKSQAPDHGQLADRWIAYHRDTKWGIGEWKRYCSGIWRRVEEDVISAEIQMIIERARVEGVRSSAGLLSSVMEIARIKTSIPAERWDADADYLPCRNGVLHIPTKTLLPHTPDIYATSQLDFDYDAAATCPNFLYALGQIDDAAEFVQEYAGYALTPDVKHEIAVWMQGAPGCGKSTVIAGLQTMLGNSRAGLLGLADIEQSRFALGSLPGKTLVFSTEQPENFIVASNRLNAIISGEPITVEQKFKDAITIIPRAKIIWAMNDLPRVSSVNNGIMRRVKVIKFPNLDESKRDPELKDRIATEGAGILNWALLGLERLRNRGRFAIPKSVDEATKDFQEKNDIPLLFLQEVNARIDARDPQVRMPAQELYDKYNDWCRRNGHKPMSSTKVAEEWRRLGFERVTINGVRHWTGVEIPAPGFSGRVP